MADIFKMKTWNNVGESEATDDNSVLNKDNINDLESRINNAINSLKTTIQEETEKELYYKTGDVQNVEGFYGGCLTSGQTQIQFTIYFPKLTKNIKIINFNNITSITVRHADGGYIANMQNLADVFTVEHYRIHEDSVEVYLTLKEKSNFANNSTVSVWIEYGTVTFN